MLSDISGANPHVNYYKTNKYETQGHLVGSAASKFFSARNFLQETPNMNLQNKFVTFATH